LEFDVWLTLTVISEFDIFDYFSLLLLSYLLFEKSLESNPYYLLSKDKSYSS
jgi:hypothetical protein